MVLSTLRQPDKLVWIGTKNGLFSFKSAYHIEKNMYKATRDNRFLRGLENYLEIESSSYYEEFFVEDLQQLAPHQGKSVQKKHCPRPLCVLFVE
jgi:patatin-like phospholipase/acyl hydrolase